MLATLAWGSITLAGLSTGPPGMHTSLVACGVVEVIAVALRKCRTQDKPAVLQENGTGCGWGERCKDEHLAALMLWDLLGKADRSSR